MRIGLALLSLLLSLFVGSSAATWAQQPEGMEPGPPHETLLEIGQPPPETSPLPAAADGTLFDLAEQVGQRPILLHFFRGTW